MKGRCHNPNHADYHLYGARGIKVCDGWRHSYNAFAAYMGDKPSNGTMDRIDNDGDYEPGNVRWATHSEQMRNRRPYGQWRKR
jgi:hypothetical protein